MSYHTVFLSQKEFGQYDKSATISKVAFNREHLTFFDHLIDTTQMLCLISILLSYTLQYQTA